MSIGVGEMIAKAKSEIENLSPDQVAAEVAAGAMLVDIREAIELSEAGMIPSAIHAPRGLLEFYADPTHAYHRPEFDPAKRVILQCASGGRSALAASTLKAMGYTEIAHLDGGLNAWKAAGREVVAL